MFVIVRMCNLNTTGEVGTSIVDLADPFSAGNSLACSGFGDLGVFSFCCPSTLRSLVSLPSNRKDSD